MARSWLLSAIQSSISGGVNAGCQPRPEWSSDPATKQSAISASSRSLDVNDHCVFDLVPLRLGEGEDVRGRAENPTVIVANVPPWGLGGVGLLYTKQLLRGWGSFSLPPPVSVLKSAG